MSVLEVVPCTKHKHTDSVAHYKVVALVPVCNEAETIEDTIRSLMAQTYPFVCVHVIANNCTDGTVAIVQRLIAEYESANRYELKLSVMLENKYKKAGALNYGLTMVGDDIDFLFGMDGDSIVDKHIIEEGIAQFKAEPETGGICTACRNLPAKANATRWQRFLWKVLNIERNLASTWFVENYKSARVLSGVSVLFRMDALREVAALNLIQTELLNNADIKPWQRNLSNKSIRKISKNALKIFSKRKDEGSLGRLLARQDKPAVWAINSLVEDYRLTLELKDIGWQVKASLDMISWSEVPLKLRGKGGLWQQRQRWYGGTIDEIRLRRFGKHSRLEIFTISLMMLNLLARLLIVSAYLILIIIGAPIQVVVVFLLLPILASAIQLYKLKDGDNLDKWQIFFTATLVVNEVYAFYRELIYANSIRVSFFCSNREW